MAQQNFNFEQVQTVNIHPDPPVQQSRPDPINFRLDTEADVHALKSWLYDQGITATEFYRVGTPIIKTLWPWIQRRMHEGNLSEWCEHVSSQP